MTNEGKKSGVFRLKTKSGIDIVSLWEQVVTLFKGEKTTPYLTVSRGKDGDSEIRLYEDEDTKGGEIYSDESVIIYPSSFQRWYYEGDDNVIKNIEDEIKKAK